MLKSFIVFFILAVLFTGSALALDQPTTTPKSDRYRIAEQKFPPLDWVISREAKPYPVYGIYTWFGEFEHLREQIKLVGWKTLRIGGPKTEENMKMLMDENINFTMMISQPQGRRDAFESDDAYINTSLEQAEQFLNKFGENGSFYKKYPQFKGRYIPYIMLRNEPNFHYMYTAGTEAQRQMLYARLVPMLSDLIRSKSPKTKIISFTTGGSGAGDMRFVEHVLEIDPRVLTGSDVFSTHPYVHPIPPEANKLEKWGEYSIANSLYQLRKTFEKYGRKDITVWYTEGGWPISKADGGAYDDVLNTVPPMFQAAYSCRYYALALRLGVDCVTNMFIIDTDGHAGGFFDRLNNMAWRPSAKAVQNMIRIMPHPKLIDAQSDGENQNFIYEFKSHVHQPDSPMVIMAYRIEGPMMVDIEVPWNNVLITDMLGDESEVTAKNGKVTIEIGPYPIYIQQK